MMPKSKSIRIAGILLALLLSACSQSVGPSTPPPNLVAVAPPMSHFGTYPQAPTFAYPAGWYAYAETSMNGQFESTYATLSNVRLQKTCSSNGPWCRRTIPELPPDSTLMRWGAGGFPGWTFAQLRGTLTRLDNLPARIRTLKPFNGCPANTAKVLDVIIARPRIHFNWYDVVACISGPHVGRVQAEVMQILRTFRSPR